MQKKKKITEHFGVKSTLNENERLLRIKHSYFV